MFPGHFLLKHISCNSFDYVSDLQINETLHILPPCFCRFRNFSEHEQTLFVTVQGLKSHSIRCWFDPSSLQTDWVWRPPLPPRPACAPPNCMQDSTVCWVRACIRIIRRWHIWCATWKAGFTKYFTKQDSFFSDYLRPEPLTITFVHYPNILTKYPFFERKAQILRLEIRILHFIS